jgi:CRISPR-associated endonuclease/helicase Cas3
MSYDDLFERATGHAAFAWQYALAHAPRLPDLVRVPTGGGKTEGAILGWLYRRRYAEADVRAATPRRLVYCLPMRVLVEQTAARATGLIEGLGLQDVVPVHILMGGHVDRDWIASPEHDQILVGTLDQLLSRALMRGYGSSRYRWPVEFGLLHADSLWVCDEVQLFGEALATTSQLSGLRAALGTGAAPHGTVWMSATAEPDWLCTVDRRETPRMLEIGADDRSGPLAQRLSAMKTVEETPEITADIVKDAHRDGRPTLVVMNTVDAARDLHRRVSRALARTGTPVVLLHSRFRPPDRRAALARMAEAAEGGGIIIATQVVEAGVDLDAEVLITEAAPWGSVVQRLGRCNRFGVRSDALVIWASPARSLPYEAEAVAEAVATLRAAEGRSLSPDGIADIDAPLRAPRRRHVLRRRDLLDLFDTGPDLAGVDLDVARFVRESDDLTASVAWRDIPSTGPSRDEPALARDELCTVSLTDIAKARKNRAPAPVYRFDSLHDQWSRLRGDGRVRPGDRLLVPLDFGCYAAETGFDSTLKGNVSSLAAMEGAEEALDADLASERRGVWLSIAEHTDNVVAALTALAGVLPIAEGHHGPLQAAARLHDLGKAHSVFQKALSAAGDVPAAAVPLAKCAGHAARYERRGFRHELASLLVYLAGDDVQDLVAYLIACHHGRVRLGARALSVERPPGDGRAYALGCWDGDIVPADGGTTDLGGGVVRDAVTLALTPLQLAASDGATTYTERALRLLDTLGPFELAYLEAVIRTADTRASALEAETRA